MISCVRQLSLKLVYFGLVSERLCGNFSDILKSFDSLKSFREQTDILCLLPVSCLQPMNDIMLLMRTQISAGSKLLYASLLQFDSHMYEVAETAGEPGSAKKENLIGG